MNKEIRNIVKEMLILPYLVSLALRTLYKHPHTIHSLLQPCPGHIVSAKMKSHGLFVLEQFIC